MDAGVERLKAVRRILLRDLDPARVEPEYHLGLARTLAQLADDLAEPVPVEVSGVGREAKRLVKALRAASRAADDLAAKQERLKSHLEAAHEILRGDDR